MLLQDRLQMSIRRRADEVVLRSELSELGGRSQLSEAIKALIDQGKLIRLGSGVYAKARKNDLGQARLTGDPEQIADEVFRKLGLDVRLVRVQTAAEGDLYIMRVSGHRVARKLEIGSAKVEYLRSDDVGSDEVDPLHIPNDVDRLPRVGVSAFVERCARAHHVIYTRSRLDDWSEAVTRAAGDDVRLDRTEKLLVALKKKNVIDGRQAARLLTNHMREAKNVRPISGSSNRRISA